MIVLKAEKNTSGEQRDSKSDAQSYDESSAVEDEINNDTSVTVNNDTLVTADENSFAPEASDVDPLATDALVVDPEVSETIKELKILVTDVKQMKHAKVLDGFATPQRTPSPKARKLRKFMSKSTNHRTLDSWVCKTPKSAMNHCENSDSTIPAHSGRTTRASIKLDGSALPHENGET